MDNDVPHCSLTHTLSWLYIIFMPEAPLQLLSSYRAAIIVMAPLFTLQDTLDV